MASLPPQLRRRLFCTKPLNPNHQWTVKQVTKSNFPDTLEEIKSHLSGSDFVAVSLRNTGSFSAPWHRVSPFDTADTAYCKAKYAAERFQVLQFAVCPFTIRASKVTAHPYNFHLFPRDELKIGMPAYSFSCQSSYLTSMAQQGFDFNACIYDGISYLSRAQEPAAKVRIGSPVRSNNVLKSSSSHSVVDEVFIRRIKSRVKHWKKACNNSGTETDEPLVRSLRKLVLGFEQHASRPCMNIDVCSERQMQLVLEMLGEFSDDLVPLVIPAKGGGTEVVRVILTSSKEDKDLLERELQNIDEEESKKVRGFRDVIDLISSSQKPIVSHNSLNDFAFIHSKFLSPLPSNIDEFKEYLSLTFPHVLDINHLMKEIGLARKVTSTPSAISYLNHRFFTPVDMEIPHSAVANEGKKHGNNVLRICLLFAKLCSILKITPSTIQSNTGYLSSSFKDYANIFSPFSNSSRESDDEEIKVWTINTRRVGCSDLVFLWGFRGKMSSGMLKSLLQGSHDVFSEEFDVRLVDRSCAIVVFWKPGLSETFLNVMNNREICGPLREMVSEGLRAAGYGTYKTVCRLGLWEVDLADSLDKVLAESDHLLEADSETKQSEIYWCSKSMINFDDL